jgi:NAD(P)H-hydrate epimerase
MAIERVTKVPSLPPRPGDGHKGLFGRVLVVGGHEGMIGAPVLAGTAALRLGAGLVEIAVPRAILVACLSITPELIGLGLGKGGGQGPLLAAAKKADALVVGPGLGQSAEALARLRRLVRLEKPMVIDADGLNLLASLKTWPSAFKARAVLTPHPGEMSRLGALIGREGVSAEDAGRVDLAAEAARAFGQIIVLKGHRTVVTDGRRAYLNHTGNSALSKAGTGDVLSGLLGCLLGQGMEPFEAAIAAVHLHGRCGELAGQMLGLRSPLARDVIAALPQAIAEAQASSHGR